MSADASGRFLAVTALALLSFGPAWVSTAMADCYSTDVAGVCDHGGDPRPDFVAVHPESQDVEGLAIYSQITHWDPGYYEDGSQFGFARVRVYEPFPNLDLSVEEWCADMGDTGDCGSLYSRIHLYAEGHELVVSLARDGEETELCYWGDGLASGCY